MNSDSKLHNISPQGLELAQQLYADAVAKVGKNAAPHYARTAGWQARMRDVTAGRTHMARLWLEALAVMSDVGATRALVELERQAGEKAASVEAARKVRPASSYTTGDRVMTPAGAAKVTYTDPADRAFLDIPEDAVTVLPDSAGPGEDHWYAAVEVSPMLPGGDAR